MTITNPLVPKYMSFTHHDAMTVLDGFGISQNSRVIDARREMYGLDRTLNGMRDSPLEDATGQCAAEAKPYIRDPVWMAFAQHDAPLGWPVLDDHVRLHLLMHDFPSPYPARTFLTRDLPNPIERTWTATSVADSAPTGNIGYVSEKARKEKKCMRRKPRKHKGGSKNTYGSEGPHWLAENRIKVPGCDWPEHLRMDGAQLWTLVECHAFYGVCSEFRTHILSNMPWEILSRDVSHRICCQLVQQAITDHSNDRVKWPHDWIRRALRGGVSIPSGADTGQVFNLALHDEGEHPTVDWPIDDQEYAHDMAMRVAEHMVGFATEVSFNLTRMPASIPRFACGFGMHKFHPSIFHPESLKYNL